MRFGNCGSEEAKNWRDTDLRLIQIRWASNLEKIAYAGQAQSIFKYFGLLMMFLRQLPGGLSLPESVNDRLNLPPLRV